MTAQNPFVEVTATGADSVSYTNQVADTDATFLRVRQITFVRNATQIVRSAEIQLDNKDGRYNAAFGVAGAEDIVFDINMGTLYDGSDKVDTFTGRVKQMKRNHRIKAVPFMTLTCRDLTADFLNTHVFETATAGSALSPSGGITIDDVSDVVTAIMAIRKYNPKSLSTNIVDSGTTLPERRVWRHKPTLEVFRELANLVNFQVYVDESNVLNFTPRNTSQFTEVTFSANTGGNVAELDEDWDFEGEKNYIKAYCGETTDSTPVIATFREAGASANPKVLWARNFNIAPNAAGSTAPERLANAKNMCWDFAKSEYKRLQSKHTYRMVINTFYPDIGIGDLIRVSDTPLGLSSTLLKVTEIRETIVPSKSFPYRAEFVLDANTGGEA